MLRSLFFVCLFVGLTQISAASSLGNVQRAQDLLGPEIWTRILRVENTARRSNYDRTVYALVFELSGILWFYTDLDGTQSLSLHRHNLAAEKADLLPLLQAIEPGFARFTLVPVEMKNRSQGSTAPLPNGCLIESLAAARRLVDQGGAVRRVFLVSFYFQLNHAVKGHTVLAYETGDGAYLLDPEQPDRSVRVGDKLPEEPMALAWPLAGRGVSIFKARALSIPLPRPTAVVLAELNRTPRRTAGTMMN